MLVDLTLKQGSGLGLIKELRAVLPQTKILVVSMHDETIYAERVMRAGTSGYLTKASGSTELRKAVRRVPANDVYLSDRLANRWLHQISGTSRPTKIGSPIDILSNRELQALELMGKGKNTRRIAQELHVSPRTVDAFRQRIKQKLRIRKRDELLRFAVEWVLKQESVQAAG